ncbi:hypothetical protein KIF59_14430 [Enterobacter cloacae subsp. cloacae]|nr:hypothetical protein [Enterobacter cloacae subsp. cloacae]
MGVYVTTPSRNSNMEITMDDPREAPAAPERVLRITAGAPLCPQVFCSDFSGDEPPLSALHPLA